MSSVISARRASVRARIFFVAAATVFSVVFAILAPQGAQATTTPTYAQMMQRVVDDTNAVRAGVGLLPLVRNADLDRVAADWARQQWQNGTMSHNPNFSTQIPSGWTRAGENVAKGYSYIQVVPAWKASPGHYANIVNDYNSIGIGYFEQDGRRYWTQLFAKYPGVTQPTLSSVLTGLLSAILSPPAVSGTATVGATWTLNPGTWTGSPTIVQAWLRCNNPITTTFTTVPAGCTAISGARSTTYVTTTADAGKYVTAQVAGITLAGTTLTGAPSTTRIPGPTPPVNTAAPTVSGAAAVGATWTLNPGTWTGTPTPTIVQAWLRCNNAVTTTFATVPAGCVAISGARSTTYVTTTADAGKYVTAQVAGINSAGTTFTGAPSTTRIPGPTPPVNTAAPTVSGAAAVGATWTMNPGTWTGSPTIVQAWLRCNNPITTTFATVPAGCVAISGARSTTYVTTTADAGKYVTAQVAGINSAGTTFTGAPSTTRIPGPTPPVNTAAPTVSGAATVGATWTLNPGTWTGTPTPTIVQAWLRCNNPLTTTFTSVPAGCVAISGARSTTYITTTADAGKYITAQVAGINSAGTTLVGATSTTSIPG